MSNQEDPPVLAETSTEVPAPAVAEVTTTSNEEAEAKKDGGAEGEGETEPRESLLLAGIKMLFGGGSEKGSERGESDNDDVDALIGQLDASYLSDDRAKISGEASADIATPERKKVPGSPDRLSSPLSAAAKKIMNGGDASGDLVPEVDSSVTESTVGFSNTLNQHNLPEVSADDYEKLTIASDDEAVYDEGAGNDAEDSTPSVAGSNDDTKDIEEGGGAAGVADTVAATAADDDNHVNSPPPSTTGEVRAPAPITPPKTRFGGSFLFFLPSPPRDEKENEEEEGDKEQDDKDKRDVQDDKVVQDDKDAQDENEKEHIEKDVEEASATVGAPQTVAGESPSAPTTPARSIMAGSLSQPPPATPPPNGGESIESPFQSDEDDFNTPVQEPPAEDDDEPLLSKMMYMAGFNSASINMSGKLKRGSTSSGTDISELKPRDINAEDKIASSPQKSRTVPKEIKTDTSPSKSTYVSDFGNKSEDEGSSAGSLSTWQRFRPGGSGWTKRNKILLLILALVLLAIICAVAFTFAALQAKADELQEQQQKSLQGFESEDDLSDDATPVPTISLGPTGRPSISGAPTLTASPTRDPTKPPTGVPSARPSMQPSNSPSMGPTMSPSDAPSMFPSSVPSVQPTMSPAGLLRAMLRDAPATSPRTLQAIDVPGTSQQKAFEWLANDPNFLDYPDFRKFQRFALGTLYFSISQPQEVRESLHTWMKYDTNECSWFTSWYENRLSCGSDYVYRYLTLRNINLVGTIPAELALMTRLDSLVLEDNALTGSIPNEFGNWKSLKNMDLGKNFLTGPLPNFNATELTRLDLSLNQLRGTIPRGIGSLTRLRYVDLTENFLYGNVPDELCFISMDSLGVDCNEVSCRCCDKCGSEETRFPVAIAPRPPTPPPTPFPTPAPTPPPTAMPSATPSKTPTRTPSSMPTGSPSSSPSARPTGDPTAEPSKLPTRTPSARPTGDPSSEPTGFPSPPPTIAPTRTPTPPPTPGPTRPPTPGPTPSPTTPRPTRNPTPPPTPGPTKPPTPGPTRTPTRRPTPQPTMGPTVCPQALIQATKNCFQYGEPIMINFNNCNPLADSWVGIYGDGVRVGQHGAPLLWKNACNSQSCLEAIGRGTVIMDEASAGTMSWPLREGEYKAWIFNDRVNGSPIVGTRKFFVGWGQC